MEREKEGTTVSRQAAATEAVLGRLNQSSKKLRTDHTKENSGEEYQTGMAKKGDGLPESDRDTHHWHLGGREVK